jgi:hypothetical protein
LGDAQRHLALLDRRRVARFEPALLHLRPFAADVARIERDLQSGQNTGLLGTRQS